MRLVTASNHHLGCTTLNKRAISWQTPSNSTEKLRMHSRHPCCRHGVRLRSRSWGTKVSKREQERDRDRERDRASESEQAKRGRPTDDRETDSEAEGDQPTDGVAALSRWERIHLLLHATLPPIGCQAWAAASFRTSSIS